MLLPTFNGSIVPSDSGIYSNMQPTPIECLPPELLSLIFVMLVDSSFYARSIGDESYRSTVYPVLFLRVCTQWRRVALSTPSLWSYLDFATAGSSLRSLGHVGRYFECSQNSPLRVRIGEYSQECLPKIVDEHIASLLRSSAPRLDSLAICYWHSSFTKEAIAILFSQGITVPIQKLALYAASGDRRMFADPELLSQQHLNQLLEPLRTLYLESVYLDWGFIPCRNLVELQLVELPWNGPPTITQLVEILRANTSLRLIKFSRFHLAFTVPEYIFQPIELPELRDLSLEMQSEFIDWFLNLLVPGPHELSLHLTSWSLSDHLDVTNTIISLSRRARITSLCISRDWLSLSHIYGSLPYLRHLRLSSQTLLESTFAGMQEAVHLLAHLHTFDIVSCEHCGGIQQGLRIMQGLESLRRIRFWNCTFYEGGERMEPEAIVRWFSRECVNGKIEVSHSSALSLQTHVSPFR
jgi:hypothetical protein